MSELPIQVMEGDVSCEIVKEPTPTDFAFTVLSSRRILMEIKYDRVFLFSPNLPIAIQTITLGILSLINAVLGLVEVYGVQEAILVQSVILVSYLIFIAPRAKYNKVVAPTQWTNLFRNKLRDDPSAKARTINYLMTVQAWNGVKQFKKSNQPVMELSDDSTKATRTHFKSIVDEYKGREKPTEDLDGFARSQKSQSDPYNTNPTSED